MRQTVLSSEQENAQRHKGVPGELSAFGVSLVYLVRKYPEEAEPGCGVLMEVSCCLHRPQRAQGWPAQPGNVPRESSGQRGLAS